MIFTLCDVYDCIVDCEGATSEPFHALTFSGSKYIRISRLSTILAADRPVIYIKIAFRTRIQPILTLHGLS